MRELQNCIERAVILTEGDTIHARHLNLSFRAATGAADAAEDEPVGADRPVGHRWPRRTRRVLVEVERRKIEQALKEAGGNKGRAAEILQMPFKLVTSKLREYGLELIRPPPVRRSADESSRPVLVATQPDRRQRLLHLLLGHVVDDRRRADRGRQHEVQLAGDHLLVVLHRLEHLRRIVTSPIGGSGPSAAIEIGERLPILLGERAARDGELRRHQHAVSDRLAVAKAPVLRHRLERVTGGVAEIEDPPQPRFALVGRDDIGLDPARFGDDRQSAPPAIWRRSPRDRCVTRSKSGRLDVMPYLMTSYKPARNSRRGSVASTARSTTTACGW